MAILIDPRHPGLPMPMERIRKTAQHALDALGCPDAELSLVFVDDAEMTDLNGQYRGKTGPTNVLAFAMHDGDFGQIQPHLLGDVVVSVDTLLREARRDGIAPAVHLVRLLVHGILHLSGFDHEASDEDAQHMEAKTEALMRSIRAVQGEENGPIAG